MHYTKPVYRPAYETEAPLLQVTDGCSYNKCAFCSMYQEVPFRVSPDDEILEDLQELREANNHVERIFLVNGDPMALSIKRLIKIAEWIHKFFPECESIGCFASILNFKNKSAEDLKKLQILGYDKIDIGVESAFDPALAMLGKGYNAAEVYKQLDKLKQAGIRFSVNLILGCQGNGRFHEVAAANAKLLNTFQPDLFFTTTLYAFPNTPLYGILYKEVPFQGKVFHENAMAQLISEEGDMLSQLELTDTTFFGSHPSNPIPMDGHFPEDQDRLLSMLEKALRFFPWELLSVPPTRGAEGGVLYPENFG